MASENKSFFLVDRICHLCEIARMASANSKLGPRIKPTNRNGKMPKGPRDPGAEATIVNINLHPRKGAEQARLIVKILTICQETGWSRAQVVRFMIEMPSVETVVREIKALEGAAASERTNHADNGD